MRSWSGCYGNARAYIHGRSCRPARPLCKRRRKEAGQLVCECPSYCFPHRLGSGHCGDHKVPSHRREQRA